MPICEDCNIELEGDECPKCSRRFSQVFISEKQSIPKIIAVEEIIKQKIRPKTKPKQKGKNK